MIKNETLTLLPVAFSTGKQVVAITFLEFVMISWLSRDLKDHVLWKSTD